MADSRPPVPAAVTIRTSFSVRKKVFRRAMMLFWRTANSGPRWLTIWRAPASRTASGSDVGPGMRRLASKRFTGSTSYGEAGATEGSYGTPPTGASVVYMTAYAETNDDTD